MSYKILGNTKDLMQGFEPRVGLEGPFNFGGRVVYYDVIEGKYYDPKSDYFLSSEDSTDMYALHDKCYNSAA
jgi:hypothetical protein